MGWPGMKVGEVARRTGLTVRTLHHYDDIQLLSPSGRSPAGHRLYTLKDLSRLQQIVSLRQLGFSLARIAEALGHPDSLLSVLERQLEATRGQLEKAKQLCRRLEATAARLRAKGRASLEELLQTTEVIALREKYFSPEQLARIEERAQAHRPDARGQSTEQW